MQYGELSFVMQDLDGDCFCNILVSSTGFSNNHGFAMPRIS
jgi:hypothetical protein